MNNLTDIWRLFNPQNLTEDNIAKCKELASIAGKILRKWQESKKQIDQKKSAELPDFFSDEDSTG